METQPSFLSLWYVRVLAVLILVGVLTSLAAYTSYTLKQSRYGYMGPTTINVRGEGEVLAKPDIGQFSFSVRGEGEDAAAAQSASAEAINKIMDYLKQSGVEEKDIKTTDYYLNPKYRYEERICASGFYCPPSEPIIDGYEVSQTITVKVRDLDQSGALISGTGDNGATNLSGLSFTIDDETTLKAEARAEAIEKAQEKAKQLSEDLGVRIVRMVGFYEEEYPGPIYGYGGAEMSMDASVKSVPAMPTGENSITSTVNITYEVR